MATATAKPQKKTRQVTKTAPKAAKEPAAAVPTKAAPKPFAIPTCDGIPLLGWAVNWSVANTTMPHKDFCALLNKHGLPDAPAILARNAAIRAMDEVQKGKEKATRTEVKNPPKDHVMWVIITVEADAAQNIKTETRTVVDFDQKDHSIKIEGAYVDEIQDKFKMLLASSTEEQVRSSIKRFVTDSKDGCQAVLMQPKLPPYFVPACKAAEMDTLRAIFNDLGNLVTPFVLPIPNVEEARSSMWQATVADLKVEMEALQRDLQDPELSEKKLQTRLERFKTLQCKAEMYETVLSGTAEELKAGLAAMGSALEKALAV